MANKTSKQVPDSQLATPFDDLHALLRAEKEAYEHEHDPELRETMARTIVQVVAEIRKVEAAASKHLDAFNRSGVIAWLRSLPKAERQSIVREAKAIDDGGSILA